MRILKEKRKTVLKAEERNILDEYGFLVDEIKALERKKEALRKKILETYGEGTHTGEAYTVIVDKVETFKLDPVAVYKALGLKNFLKVVSIKNEEVKAYIPSSELSKYVKEVTEFYRVTAKRRGK